MKKIVLRRIKHIGAGGDGTAGVRYFNGPFIVTANANARFGRRSADLWIKRGNNRFNPFRLDHLQHAAVNLPTGRSADVAGIETRQLLIQGS
jgi:hypothetical protein